MSALAPVLEPADGLFPSLLAGLEEFRARVEGGEHRERILGLQGESGVVFDVVKVVLETLRDVIVWLRDAIAELGVWIVQTDALLAVVEIFGLGLQGLGQALDQPDWPEPFEGLLAGAGGAVADFGGAVASLPARIPPSIIPRPETLDAIVAESEALVGTVEPPTTGSLNELLQELSA